MTKEELFKYLAGNAANAKSIQVVDLDEEPAQTNGMNVNENVIIKLKRGTGGAPSLEDGEIAIGLDEDSIYFKNDEGEIVALTDEVAIVSGETELEELGNNVQIAIDESDDSTIELATKEDLDNGLKRKMDKPSNNGTSGQVLTKTEGGAEWMDGSVSSENVLEFYNGGIRPVGSTSNANTGSFAENTSVTASGEYSHAEGNKTSAMTDASHAEGSGTTASGQCSHAEGYGTTAGGGYSHAEGRGTTASGGYGSHAEGYGTTASQQSSHAEGEKTTASGSWSHAEGYLSTANGGSSHAEGYNTTASGSYSHSEGFHTVANGGSSHTEGNKTSAMTDSSHAEGSGTTASGSCAHAEGRGTTASGEYSHAEGSGTTASGNYSHAEGSSTIASGHISHAEGFETTASGNYSHAEGGRTEAIGVLSHAEGNMTKAVGEYSHAGGVSSVANGDGSQAQGYSTVTNNFVETAIGELNISTEGPSKEAFTGDENSTLFSIGNGYSNWFMGLEERHNAFEVKQNGDIYISDTNNQSTVSYFLKPMIKLQDAIANAGSNVDVVQETGTSETAVMSQKAVTDALENGENNNAQKFAGNDLSKFIVYKTDNDFDALDGNTIKFGKDFPTTYDSCYYLTIGRDKTYIQLLLPIRQAYNNGLYYRKCNGTDTFEDWVSIVDDNNFTSKLSSKAFLFKYESDDTFNPNEAFTGAVRIKYIGNKPNLPTNAEYQSLFSISSNYGNSQILNDSQNDRWFCRNQVYGGGHTAWREFDFKEKRFAASNESYYAQNKIWLRAKKENGGKQTYSCDASIITLSGDSTSIDFHNGTNYYPPVGYDYKVILKGDGTDRNVTIPCNNVFKTHTGEALKFKVPANGFVELSLMYDGTYVYVKPNTPLIEQDEP